MTSGSKPPFALTSVAASRSLRRARRPAIKRSKSASTAIGKVPPRSSSFRVSREMRRSSKARYCRLPTTQTSPALHVARPTLSDEADRRGFRQGEHGPPVHIAQHVDSAHERRRSRHALEDEGIEEGRNPTADAGIVLDEHLVGIELFRPRQCLGLL